MMHPGLGYFDVRFLFLWSSGGNIFLRKKETTLCLWLSFGWEDKPENIWGTILFEKPQYIYKYIICYVYILCVYIIDTDIFFLFISIGYACWHLLSVMLADISTFLTIIYTNMVAPSVLTLKVTTITSHLPHMQSLLQLPSPSSQLITIPMPQSYQLHLHHKLHHAHQCQQPCSVPLYSYLPCLTTSLAQHPFYRVVHATLLLLSHKSLFSSWITSIPFTNKATTRTMIKKKFRQIIKVFHSQKSSEWGMVIRNEQILWNNSSGRLASSNWWRNGKVLEETERN